MQRSSIDGKVGCQLMVLAEVQQDLWPAKLIMLHRHAQLQICALQCSGKLWTLRLAANWAFWHADSPLMSTIPVARRVYAAAGT